MTTLAPGRPYPFSLVLAGRALLDALIAGDSAAAHTAVAAWRANLTAGERHQAALLALAAAEPGDVLDLLDDISVGAGMPDAPWEPGEYATEAESWADWATVAELRAYAAEAAGRLPERDRRQLGAVLSGAAQ